MTYQTQKAPPDRVRALASVGHSQSSIATILGVSCERIRQICDRDGIETLPGNRDYDKEDAFLDAVAAGHHVSEAARIAGTTSRGRMRDLARAAGIDLSKYKKPAPVTEEIRELAATGMTVKEVANALGISLPQVSQSKAKHGIVFLTDGRKKRWATP